MARPPKFDRDEALGCAMKVFWEKGFDGTSISDLTAAMGISPPSLYAAFGDKQSLFDAAVDLYEQDAVLSPALKAATARDVAEQIFSRAVDLYTRPAHPRGCMVIADPTLQDRRRSGKDAIVRRLRRAKRTGDLPADSDPRALADYLDLVLRGMSSKARDGATRAQLRAAADIALAAWPAPARNLAD